MTSPLPRHHGWEVWSRLTTESYKAMQCEADCISAAVHARVTMLTLPGSDEDTFLARSKNSVLAEKVLRLKKINLMQPTDLRTGNWQYNTFMNYYYLHVLEFSYTLSEIFYGFLLAHLTITYLVVSV